LIALELSFAFLTYVLISDQYYSYDLFRTAGEQVALGLDESFYLKNGFFRSYPGQEMQQREEIYATID